jgi:hypothetical protein
MSIFPLLTVFTVNANIYCDLVDKLNFDPELVSYSPALVNFCIPLNNFVGPTCSDILSKFSANYVHRFTSFLMSMSANASTYFNLYKPYIICIYVTKYVYCNTI